MKLSCALLATLLATKVPKEEEDFNEIIFLSKNLTHNLLQNKSAFNLNFNLQPGLKNSNVIHVEGRF